MSISFLSLPREIRDQIYGLALVDEEVLDPWASTYPTQNISLMRTNKLIHREASSVFYGQNWFNFASASYADESIAAFVKGIGEVNASHIQYVSINFPVFDNLDPDDPSDVTLTEASINILTIIRTKCASLATILTSLWSTYGAELRLDRLDSPKVVVEALKLVNTHFKAIASLPEIVVDTYEDGPSGQIRKEMESHGWTIRTSEKVEEAWDSEEEWGGLYGPAWDWDGEI